MYEKTKPEIDIYERETKIEDLDDAVDSLALETFKELSFETDTLSLQAFLEWEDIKEVQTVPFATCKHVIYVFFR